MINALEKVVYPNGKTQSLAEIGGAVEGLSALIDEVDKNTSAISSITSQLSALVADVDTNTSAIRSINQQLGQLVGDWTLLGTTTAVKNLEYISSIDVEIADLLSEIENKEILFNFVCKNDQYGTVGYGFQDIIDGDILRANIALSDSQTDIQVNAGSACYSAGPHPVPQDNVTFMYGAFFSYVAASSSKKFRVQYRFYDLAGDYHCTFSIYVKDKPTPPTRTAKKKAIAKKKGDSK